MGKYFSKLEFLRQRAGLTQKDLAGTIGVSDFTYRNWISGRSRPALDFSQMKRICRVLDCTIDDLPDDPSEMYGDE